MPNKRFLFVSWDSLIGDIAWQTLKDCLLYTSRCV